MSHAKLLIRNISRVVTFDEEDRELENADILIEGPAISSVGHGLSVDGVDQIIDGRGLLALPGLVNSHQHLYQGALRAIPDLERTRFPSWIVGMAGRCQSWCLDGRFTPEVVRAVSRAVLLESLASGVTTVADQHYFHPAGPTQPFVEATIESAHELGIRFHACRGTLTLGRAQGGTADDGTVQDVDEVLRHCSELIDRYHDARPFSMTRVALAPCGPHVDRPETFQALADLAASHSQVGLHTHLYSEVDAQFCEERYGLSPWEVLANNGWAREGVWLAHVVTPHPPDAVLREWADVGIGVSTLPTADLRVGWGIAPLRRMLNCGVSVGFATTGSASNDAANMLGDMRVAALIHRSTSPEPAEWLSVRELLRMGTRGSARCIGRDDTGVLAQGYAADIACWDMTRVDRVGIHDPVIGLVFTGLSTRANLVLVNGEVLVRHGSPTRIDEQEVARAASALLASCRT